MHAATDRLEFAPPATPGLMRAMLLALLAHGALLVALTSGIRWNHESPLVNVEAELWSAVPVEAAPPPSLPLPEPAEPPPIPRPPPEPVKAKPIPEPEPAPPPKVPDADIVLQQERLRLKKLHEQEQRAQKLQEQKKLEKLKLEKQESERLKLEKLKQDKLKQAQADKAEKTALDKLMAEQEAKQIEAQRAKNLARISGLAGATGSPTSTGTALKSSGPSAGYAGKISARVKPNIVFTEDIAGNPTAEVEVLTSPTGTIISRKIVKSSGLKSWDEAVLKALDKTEVLPLDNGKIYNPMTLVFRPKD